MKKLQNQIVIFGILAVLIIIGSIIYINVLKSEMISAKEIKSITLINNKIGRGKEIADKQDIDTICKLFNTQDMAVIKNWNGHFDRIGGNSYTFFFNFHSGTTRRIGYYDGSYLIMGESAYRIDSTEFEEFWELNYEEWKFAF